MNTKNNWSLENYRSIFFKIGLAIALMLALITINYEMPHTKHELTTVKIKGLEIYQIDNNKMVTPP